MAERWQQWMPHDIDSWQGSANIQALSDLAYRAVHNLLQDMWKQSDCALPDDDKELAKRSRVTPRWSECRDEVRDYFTDRTDDGRRITHRILFRKWNEAREVYEKRQNGARKTNSSRSHNAERSAVAAQSERSAERNSDTGTSTGTSTGTEKQEADDEPTVEEIVCAHPSNVTRKLTELQAPMSQCAAVIDILAAGESRASVLTKTKAICRVVLDEWPPGERKFLVRVEDFFRKYEFNRPIEEWRYGGNKQNQIGRSIPAVERQRVTHDSIRAAGARRYGIGAADVDGRGAGPEAEPGASGGNPGRVPSGVGDDRAEVRNGGVQGRVIEGAP